MTPERIRVAALQFFIRPAQSFEAFRDQVESLVETAADYNCELVVFPEYFTVQLLTLGNIKRPVREQIRDLAAQLPQFQELMSSLARRFRIYIVAGTIPVIDPGSDQDLQRQLLFRALRNLRLAGQDAHDPLREGRLEDLAALPDAGL